MSRRERGRLEAEILRALWAAPDGLTARAVTEGFAKAERPEVTTVLTVMRRLERKGLVQRDQQPGGAIFSAVRDEAEQVASDMAGLLGRASDRQAVLTQFTGSLSRDEIKAMRDALRKL